MHKILTEILISTKREVSKRKNSSSSSSFKKIFLNPKKAEIALIAEVKFSSPSEGKLGNQADLLKLCKTYAKSGADAISIITEEKHFNGNLDFVSQVKGQLNLPVLQKDFVIDEFQIYEAKNLGSDALLLIARIVPEQELIKFVKLCQNLDIEPVVEINSLIDLQKTLKTDTKIIAVNARDLDTFEVNLDSACQLLEKIPDKYIKLGFSGIHFKADVEKYKKAGAKGVLVGTELMKSKNKKVLIKELKHAS